MSTVTTTSIVLGGVIKEYKLPIEVCKTCLGEGNITTFCGHDVEETCPNCKGKGYHDKREKQYSVER